MATQGAIITDFGSYDKGQFVIQINGKIYVLGTTSGLSGDDLAIARYNNNGSLDTSFSGDGKLTATSFMTIKTVFMLSDGKFLTIGSSNGDFAIARYNSNGSLDTSFSGDGKVTTSLSSYIDVANAVTVQSDAKLVVVGGYSRYIDTARYNSDGSLDTTFSSDGMYVGSTYNSGYAYGEATATAIQPDGKTIVVSNGYGDDFTLFRFDRTGNLELNSSVDLGGKDIPKAVTVLSSGKMLVAGTSDGHFAAVRYNTNGTVDKTFATNGGVVTDLSGTETINKILILSDSKFLAVGTSSDNDLALIRFNSNGSLDSTFGTNGKVTTDLGGWEEGNSVTLQSDGKILVAGITDTDFALVRYNTNGTLDTSFSGVATVQHAPTGSIKISDTTPTVGDTLTASNTLADADGLGAISYTWKTGTTVLGTGATHKVLSSEVGKTLSVTASYTDGLGKAESVSSSATAAVVASGVVNPPTGTAGVNITGSDLSTSEQGDTAVFSVKLNTAPTRDVSITFTSSDTTEGVISKSTLVFTSANWSTPQTLTLTGQNDNLVDGSVAYTVSGKITSIDVIYKSILINSLTLTNKDTPVAATETVNGTDGIDILQGTAAPTYMLGKAGDDDLSGGAGNDTIYGSYGYDNLFGEDGDDKLYGEQDDDYIEGGAGNDTLDGGLGADTMIGGKGNDTYYLGYDATDTIIDGGSSTDIDTVIMPYQLTSYTLPTGIENANIAAGTGSGKLVGNSSNNKLTGNDGANTLDGGLGRDSLFGGTGNDSLAGGADNDVLNGGTGVDALVGGSGQDTFQFTNTANNDKLTDFSVIDDTIQLENAIFNKLTATGALNTSYLKIGTAAADSNDYLIYNKATGALLYDADGNGAGAAVQLATLGVNLALTNADFVVI